MDDDLLTKEEIALYLEATRRRMADIERKALTRLTMNDEEKALHKVWRSIQKNPELRDLVVNFLIASCNGSGQV